MPPHPHALPVERANKVRFLAQSLIWALILAFTLGISLYNAGIPIGTVLPTCAPIWIGILSLGYMMQTEK